MSRGEECDVTMLNRSFISTTYEYMIRLGV